MNIQHKALQLWWRHSLIHYADDVTVYTSKLWSNTKQKFPVHISQLCKSLPYTLYIVPIQGQNTQTTPLRCCVPLSNSILERMLLLCYWSRCAYSLFSTSPCYSVQPHVDITQHRVPLPCLPHTHTTTPPPLLSLPASQRRSVNTLQQL